MYADTLTNHVSEAVNSPTGQAWKFVQTSKTEKLALPQEITDSNL